MTLNLEQIKEIIPHRDPFLLIDEVTELEPGVSVTAKKSPSDTLYCLPPVTIIAFILFNSFIYGLAVGGDFRRNTYNPFKAALLLYLCTVNLSTVFPKKNKQIRLQK